MTNLYSIVASQPTFKAAELLEWLSEVVEVRRDPTSYTWSGVAAKLIALGVEPAIVSELDVTLVSLPGGSLLDRMLASGGVDFTGPVIRGSLAAIADKFPDFAPVVSALLAIGIAEGPRWKKHGLTDLPTVEAVQTVIDEIAAEAARDEVAAWASGLWAGVIQPAVQNGATIEEIKALVAGA